MIREVHSRPRQYHPLVSWNEKVTMAGCLGDTEPSCCYIFNLMQQRVDTPLASCTLYMYEPSEGRQILRQGHYKLRLWPEQEEHFPPNATDCNTCAIPTYYDVAEEYGNMATMDKVSPLFNLSLSTNIKLYKEYEDGFIEPEDFQATIDPKRMEGLFREEAEKSTRLYLIISLPLFYSIIYYEPAVIWTKVP